MKSNVLRKDSVSPTHASRLHAVECSRLKCLSDLHLARKAWHFLTGLMMAVLYSHWLTQTASLWILSAALGAALLFEMARMRVERVNRFAVRFWGPIMRADEVRGWSGTVFYLASALLAVAIFPKPIAILAILYLACGDPMASVVGILLGHLGPRFRNGKSLIGSLGGALVCMLLTGVFLSAYPVSFPILLVMSVLGGLAGGFAELLPLEVNDNLSIPLVSGFVLWVGFICLGI